MGAATTTTLPIAAAVCSDGPVDVVTVDPADDPAMAGWFAAFDACHRHLWPRDPAWTLDEIRAQAVDRNRWVRTVLLAAVDGGSVTGVAKVEIPESDNRHLLEVVLAVPPDHRWRGAGTALVVAVENLALEEGRTVVAVEEALPVGADAGPVERFATGHGYSVVLEEVRRDLAVPLPDGRLAAVEQAALPLADGYDVVTFADRWPDHLLDDRVVLGRRMSTDPPFGDYDREEERWDRNRVRRTEELVVKMGRRLLVAAAVHRDSGRAVGYTEIAVPNDRPELAHQWDTLVLGDHRGHRLGLLMKVANLRQLAATSPATTSVTTWNARQNDSMIAVNDALGCVVVGHQREWQKRLG